MKANSTIKPEILSSREKDGSRLYSYNITESTRTDENGNEEITYDFQQVRVYEPVTANKILEAVITDLYDQSYELKLINEYNSTLNGLYTDADVISAKKEAYLNYLEERARLKSQVDSDWELIK